MYMRTTKVSKQCHMCGETIEVVPKNQLQEIVSNVMLDLRTHFHYKKEHNTSYLKIKGVVKRIFKMFMYLFLGIIFFPIWLITYPFWLIHELLN